MGKIFKDDIIYRTCFNGYAVIGLIKDCQKKTIQIPSHIDGMKVVEIGRNAFANNDVLTEVYLPAELDTIGERAFYNCKRLKKVVFSGIHSAGVSLGRAAFYGCSDLESFGNPVRFNGLYVFQNCYSLKDVSIIGDVLDGAFWGDYKLQSVHIFSENDESDVDIADGAFTGCTNIKNMYFYAEQVSIFFKELNLLKNTALYCEEDCNLWELSYVGYEMHLIR